LLKKHNAPPFSYTHGGKHHGVPALSFPFFHILSFFPSYIYRKIKNTFMEEKEVAQGLFDGGVRKTFCGKKEMYVALMAEPTFSQFSKFMPVSKKDEVSAMRTLVKDCFIEGDHELVNNNFRFLFGLMGQLTDLLSPARARS